MCAEALKVHIDDSQVKALMRESPKIFNQEFNRSFARIMGAFTRKFAKERLGKGGIRVGRKGVFSNRGGVKIALKARKLGFTGAFIGKGSLSGKAAVVRNSNPIAKAHEYGAVIRPSKGTHLFIPVRSVAKARRAGVNIPRGQKPKVIRVKKVVIKPKLGFFKTWRAFTPEATKRLGESLKRAAERIIKKARSAKKLRVKK